MPSVRRRPGRRTFYLDTSTLSYAFAGEGGFADLRAEVERIAMNENLVLSLMHVKEVAQWGNANVHNFIDWIDSLDTVWTIGMDRVCDLEDDRALQLAVGATAAAPVDVFAGSLSAAFRALAPHAFAEAIAEGRPLHAFFTAAQQTNPAKERGLVLNLQARFHFDRLLDPAVQAMTPHEKQLALDSKLDALLREDAERSFQRLRGVDIPAFHARARQVDWKTLFVNFVNANPTELPAFFVSREFARRWATDVAPKTPYGSKTQNLGSAIYDYAHALVGVYCDVFTCDDTTRRQLGNVREQLGKPPPLAYTGGRAAQFTEALASA